MRAMLVLLVMLTGCPGEEGGGACPMTSDADAGDLPALKAQRCNVPASMGMKNWYRLSAALPDATTVVQVELWPYLGAFNGGTVHACTFQLTGDELGFTTCGVCLRAVADRGLPTEREYFATAGTVEVTAVGPDAGVPFVATVLEASFGEVDDNRALVSSGCEMNLARVKMAGSVMVMGGGGGGGGGGGNAGNNGCKTTVGD